MIKPETISKALAVISKGGANYKYFFDKISSPDWIEPLAQADRFTEPPEVITQSNGVRFPFWPESAYLARVASEKPKEVLGVLLKLPWTENPRVHDDVVKAALAMPPIVAARLVKTIGGYLRAPYHTLLHYEISNLILHLVRGGATSEALSLARDVLALRQDPNAEERRLSRLAPEPQPMPFIHQHDYEDILNKCASELVNYSGQSAFSFLCEILDSYMRLARIDESYDGPMDASFIQRAAIEDSPQNWNHNLIDALIVAIRDAASALTSKDPSLMQDILKLLEGHNWNVFYRIGFWLLYSSTNDYNMLAAERLLNRDYFDSVGLRHEYALLSKRFFKTLSPNAQATILSWIDQQDTYNIRESAMNQRGQALTDAEVEDGANRRRLQRLAPIRNDLPTEWVRRYDAMVAVLGEPAHPEFLIYNTGIMMGPNSPKEEAELAAMPVANIIEYLNAWEAPEGVFMGASPEGLGRELRKAVADSPNRFANDAHRFIGIAPTYVRALLGGLEDAIRADHSFDIHSALTLCEWVTNQSYDNSPAPRSDDEDPGWEWSKKQVASLLDAALVKAEMVPFDLRGLTWRIIKPLTNDPDPTPEFEIEYGGSNMEPAMLALNTVRGQAMHAVVRYAGWVCRNLDIAEDWSTDGGLDTVPEAREVLEERLNPSKDPSQTVRSVYGQFLPILSVIDWSWVRSHLSKILPDESSMGSLRRAAWDAYVTLNQPYNRLLDLLAPYYHWAIHQLADADSEGERNRSTEALAHHLMVYAGRGNIDMTSDDGILSRFFRDAPPSIRARAIRIIGNWMINDASNAEVVERFKIVWENRLAVAMASPDRTMYAEELAEFGWWFSSGAFDLEWSLRQLKDVLGVVGFVQDGHDVLARLAAVSSSFPSDAFECLTLLLEAKQKEWDFYYWSESVNTVLQAAFESGDAELYTRAEGVIHKLGAQGIQQYRSLIERRKV